MSTALEIPLFIDQSVYTLETDLGDTTFSLRLYWSPRAHCWLLDVRHLDGEPVLLARPVVAGVPLNLGIGEPDGYLLVVGQDPERDGLGTTGKLIYWTAT